MTRLALGGALAAALALAGCVSPQGPPAPVSRPTTPTAPPAAGAPVSSPPLGPVRGPRVTLPPAPAPLAAPPAGATAQQQGVRPGPAVTALGISDAEARSALAAFRISCRSLVRRTDNSGLTRGADWQPACDAAASWRDGDAINFFPRYFETAIVGEGKAFATGYYEPEIKGSRTRRTGYEVPIYGRPDDLIEVDLGLFADDLKGRRIRGQAKDGKLIRYPDRAAIVGGAIDGRAPVIAWAADPIEFFFLQVQGSGLIDLPDGGRMRVGYDTQNGREYTGIGAFMRDRGLLQPGQSSMQGIMATLRAMPDGGASIMNENKSFVFFRELFGPGPLGALGLPVTGRTTVAADPAFVPLGAPVFLALDRVEATGLWVAQDTGGAIKGANRFDTFWGAGEDARRIAGGMSGRGNAWLLLPKGSVARLNAATVTGNGGPAPRR
ncbi:MltA domain-containing protein [Sphingomonas sp. MM-1]|uniref:murein transglycosylase A n=1 Tax=Sphingomonas sp. MM-1 TaxID=745310 RepID=UPI0002C0C427|nr:murein transglycosylase A [Sphingomonas sp. MM-1]AGH50792.1 MltA domain-containing protein [Sphingomonas sp. MM-1]